LPWIVSIPWGRLRPKTNNGPGPKVSSLRWQKPLADTILFVG
jgi:hypothetical protein